MSLASELRHYSRLAASDARLRGRKDTARVADILAELADKAERKAANAAERKRRQRARQAGEAVPRRSRQLRAGQDGDWHATRRTEDSVTLRRST